jgi:anti-sigma factor RsiW
MLPIDPVELSAFLDGELPARRAEEVRAALAQDPVLRQSYELLVVREVDWNARAAATMFRPRVRIPRAPVANRFVTAAAVVLGLLLLRMTLKALPPLYGAGLEALLLAIVVGWGLRPIMQTTDADRRRYVLARDC